MATWTIVALGNPGTEYENTRHNTGRIVLDLFRTQYDLPEWKADKKTNALISKGEVEESKVVLVEPETFMNLSGESVRLFIKKPEDVERLIVVQDELDLPFGTYKISFDRSSGGHNGIQSIVDHLHTQAFTRVRIGVSPVSADGALKKPHGDEAVHNFILGKFSGGDREILEKLAKEIAEAITIVMREGKVKAMTMFN